jgi:hypothetical protein
MKNGNPFEVRTTDLSNQQRLHAATVLLLLHRYCFCTATASAV